MKQSQLERAVAQATGETRETIRQRGFTLVEVPQAGDGVPRCVDCPATSCAVRSASDNQACAVEPDPFPSTTTPSRSLCEAQSIDRRSQ